MANEKEFVLTQQGLDELKAELEQLKTVTRKEVSEKIKQARSFGDLSENSEYDEAKNEQAEVEARISEIEYMLKYVKIIDSNEIKNDSVSPGSTVRILDVEFDEELEYTIVGSAEADLDKGKLSYESPIGKALLHHGVGEIVSAVAPGGETLEFKILEII